MEQYTVFVTGGAGFIGSNFVHSLLRSLQDVRIVVFDKLTYAGNLENLATLNDDPRFSFICGDICDVSAVRKAMRGCRWIVHFAAESHVDRSIVDPSIFMKTNIDGIFTLLEAARTLDIERFVHISTAEIYGNVNPPDSPGRLPLETDALKPLSPYAASKASADCLALSYWVTFGLPVVITRSTNNYGPYQYPEKQLPLFITNALAGRLLPIYGNGHNIRDWIHVDDHCAALMAILTAPVDLVIGEIFNIGTGEERSILENAQAVLDLLRLPRNRISFVADRLGHVERIGVNTEKLRERLGWAPQISFQEGLERTIAWYRDNQTWLKHIFAKGDTFLEHAVSLELSDLWTKLKVDSN